MSSILGISSGFHDSSCCLIDNNAVIFAAQEERFSRVKNDSSFPTQTLRFIANNFRKELESLEAVCFFERPWLRYKNMMALNANTLQEEDFLNISSKWLEPEQMIPLDCVASQLGLDRKYTKYFYSEHHLSHACYAIASSQYKSGLAFIFDAIGEKYSCAIYSFTSNKLPKHLQSIQLPFSLGFLYTYFTSATGFKPNSGEYKMMGLAPYGKPTYLEKLRSAFFSNTRDPFSLNLDKSIFEIKSSSNNFSFLQRVLRSEGISLPLDFDRNPNETANLAASIQALLEETILDIVNTYRDLISDCCHNIVFGGGVALNCKMIRFIYDKTNFNIHVPNSPGDAGSSIGACSAYLLHRNRKSISTASTKGQSLTISNFTGSNISNVSKSEIVYKSKSLNLEVVDDGDQLLVMNLIKRFKIGAWCDGQSEFGPRALGHRSIICRHDSLDIKDIVNSRIKHRESFRPFAGIFTENQALENFDLMGEIIEGTEKINRMHYSMTTVARSKGLINKENSSIIHHDNTCRLQILDKRLNSSLVKLLDNLFTNDGIVGLLNTSLNINGEPNCESIDDVLETFFTAQLDFIFVNGLLIHRH